MSAASSAPHATRSGATNTATPGYEQLEQAANWYAVLCSENATEAERLAWQAWLAQSPANAGAWQHIEAVSRRFEPLRGTAAEAAIAGVDTARRARNGRRRVLSSVAGLFGLGAGLGLASWLGWRHTALPETLLAWGADYRTATGEQRDITLADGTQVWLNTGSALSVAYQSGARLLKLAVGEILVQTAGRHDGRPFYVETRFGRMQALGTRFAVHHDEHRSRLDVFEGAVEIRNTAGLVQRIDAGQGASFTADSISAVAGAERAREAWHRGVLLADNIPLRELLAELARYRPGHISVAPDVAEITVMGVYPATDTDRALAMLENTLPIRVKRTLPWWLSVEAK